MRTLIWLFDKAVFSIDGRHDRGALFMRLEDGRNGLHTIMTDRGTVLRSVTDPYVHPSAIVVVDEPLS